MYNFQSPPVKRGADKQQPRNTITFKTPFKTDDAKIGRVFDRKQQRCKQRANETLVEEKRDLENPMNSLILGLGNPPPPPMCWNLIICPYCRIALFGRQQYQEHCAQFHPQSNHHLHSCKQTADDQNEDLFRSKPALKRSHPTTSLNNISYKLTKYEVPENLKRVFRHFLPMPIQKVFSYKQYANPKNSNNKDLKSSNDNLLAVNKQLMSSEKANCCAMMIKPSSQSPAFEAKQYQHHETIPPSSSGIFRYSEKWQEFQKCDSPIRVEHTQHPIILGPYTTLEQFEYEIFKKINNFKMQPNQHQITVSHNC